MNIEQEDGDDEEAEVNVLVVPVLVRTKISTEGSGFTNTNITQPSYSAGRLTHPERPRHLCRAAYWQKTVLWLFISSHLIANLSVFALRLLQWSVVFLSCG